MKTSCGEDRWPFVRNGLIVASLIGSIGVKIVFGSAAFYQRDLQATIEPLAESLTAGGFTVFNFDKLTVGATRDSCSIVMQLANIEGGMEDAFSLNFGTVGEVRYLYRGNFFVARPTFRAIYDRYYGRLLSSFGYGSSQHPLYMIAVGPACEEALPIVQRYDGQILGILGDSQ